MYEVYNSRFNEIMKKSKVFLKSMCFLIRFTEEQAGIIKVEKEVEKETVTQDILNYEAELRRKKLEIYEVNNAN